MARDLAAQAVAISESMAAFKAKALADIEDLISISLERYGVKLGGKKGNVSITTYDGEFKIERALANRLSFTEEILAAKELIYACIRKWSAGADRHLMALVDRAFTGRNGEIRTNDVLDLMRLEIDDEDWKTAMEALRDSIQVNGKAVYIRVYRRIGDDRYVVPGEGHLAVGGGERGVQVGDSVPGLGVAGRCDDIEFGMRRTDAQQFCAREAGRADDGDLCAHVVLVSALAPL